MSKKQISNLVPLGLKPARSPKEAAQGADLVILFFQTGMRSWKRLRGSKDLSPRHAEA